MVGDLGGGPLVVNWPERAARSNAAAIPKPNQAAAARISRVCDFQRIAVPGYSILTIITLEGAGLFRTTPWWPWRSPAPSLSAHKPLVPVENGHLGAVALGHRGRVGLDLVAAIETPHDQPTRAAAALPKVIGGALYFMDARSSRLLKKRELEPHRVSRRPFCLRPTLQYGSAQAGHNRRPRPRQEGGFRSARGGGGC